MALKVLIVDDEAMPRAVLQKHLPWAELGIETVLTAEDGQDGLEQAQLFRPEIIICDVKMPRMNGLEMAAAVRAFLPTCQFIFLSGYSDKEYLKGAIKVKAANYVEKPIDLDEITAALREVTAELRRNAPRDPGEVFFHGEQTDRPPLNKQVFSIGKDFLRQIERCIRHNQRDETLSSLNRLYAEVSRCEGTDPGTLRHLYCQIILLFLNAAETHNIPSITSRSDYLLYTAARQDTLAGLWAVLRQTAQEYFSALDHQEPDITQKVEDYIAKHYAESALTVQDIAADLGFANTYLCAAYKKGCGKTINQRLTEIRLRRAKELLQTTDRKLYEIANAVGYADGKYFVKLFTREEGLSPKQYRERHVYEG